MCHTIRTTARIVGPALPAFLTTQTDQQPLSGGGQHENDDVIVGLGGKDDLRGEDGNDVLCGDEGKDTLKGEPGNDFLDGGPDRDTLRGDQGTDICINGKKLKKCEG